MSETPALRPATVGAALPLLERLHVVVRVGAERFAFAVADVEEARDVLDLVSAPDDRDDRGGRGGRVGALRCRDLDVAAYDAGWALGVPRDGRSAGALVLRHGESSLALVVDDVEDLVMVEPQWVRRVPGGADADAVLSGVYRAPRRQGGLVCLVRVGALLAHVEALASSASEPSP